MRKATLAAVVTAATAWIGLILQFAILADAIGLGLASWRFIGYFTILSNIGIALVATAICLGRKNWLTGPQARLSGLTAILTVGVAYSLLLRSHWNPTGLQKLADVALHDVTPVLYALLWAMMPHGELRWGDLKWALVPPALYLGYALGRGSIDGWYAYWFLNPNTRTMAEMGAAIAGMMLLFGLVAAGAIALDRWLAAPRRQAEPA